MCKAVSIYPQLKNPKVEIAVQLPFLRHEMDQQSAAFDSNAKSLIKKTPTQSTSHTFHS